MVIQAFFSRWGSLPGLSITDCGRNDLLIIDGIIQFDPVEIESAQFNSGYLSVQDLSVEEKAIEPDKPKSVMGDLYNYHSFAKMMVT